MFQIVVVGVMVVWYVLLNMEKIEQDRARLVLGHDKPALSKIGQGRCLAMTGQRHGRYKIINVILYVWLVTEKSVVLIEFVDCYG